jgi:integrase
MTKDAATAVGASATSRASSPFYCGWHRQPATPSGTYPAQAVWRHPTGARGLRLGEIVALEWRDVDLAARRLTVQRSDWCGHVTVPKGGRPRRLPMTQRLTAALKSARHLRGERVLCVPGGSPITRDRVIKAIRGAQRVAGLAESGVHLLRHTFCSHLAMKGAPARAIQELAGHADLTTTQRYMHLSPAATEDAIRLLDERLGGLETVEKFGDILETESAAAGSPCGGMN